MYACRTFKVVLGLSFLSGVTLLTIGWSLFQKQRLQSNGNTISINYTVASSYKMVVAIRTARRMHSTVLGLVIRLATERNYRDYKILVWQSYSSAADEETRQTLEGLGATVFTQREVYPELSDESGIKITWGDPLAQVKWRTNHVLDFANLLERSLQYETDFILMLEDDMLPAKNSLDKVFFSLRYDVPIRANLLGYVTFFSMSQYALQYGMIDITKMMGPEGACALGFHRSFAQKLIQRLRTRPYDNPVDIALWVLIGEDQNMHVFERIPNLFQHIPKESTLFRPASSLKNSEDRSTRFVYDENNNSLLLHPSYGDGYIGCFNDVEIFSDLDGGWMLMSGSATISNCSAFCRTRLYLFMGIQSQNIIDGTVVCMCGNGYGLYGQGLESDCPFHTRVEGRCGKYLKNAVYRTEPFNATYVGCYRDHAENRDLHKFIGGLYKPATCMKACWKYEYFGLQYGGECYCGNLYGDYGPAEETQCSIPCAMDPKLICGGHLLNSIFRH